MPSKQANDVLAVEELVHEIRENLRLKAKPTHHQATRSSRPSPYHIPCRSWSEPVCGAGTDKAKAANKAKTKGEETIDDPYEFLQTLLKNNNLVKEAVRRLQHGLSPKQRYFYESDEESSRSPLVVMCQLES
ncbi:GSK-3-binding protein-like [Anopheles nili]|uniref:GSK-3-binding protein-like n=1 Tax=Anopheles nili TaxID=185578 RepID=UPI00237B2AD6|nr:GSK-3-binding protein-like [Anopheles nili]